MNLVGHASAVAATGKIGPGRLILIVGPSGAGKDTLIGAVRAHASALFPRRVITRPSSSAEDHDTISDVAFEQAAADGAFAFWWQAHDLKYGIPVSIDDDVRAGRTVVCNVSRAIVPEVRERYAAVMVVLVTAPREVLAARVTARQRSSDGSVAKRTSRLVDESELRPDVVIENVGAVEVAAGRLLKAITGEEPTGGL